VEEDFEIFLFSTVPKLLLESVWFPLYCVPAVHL